MQTREPFLHLASHLFAKILLLLIRFNFFFAAVEYDILEDLYILIILDNYKI